MLKNIMIIASLVVAIASPLSVQAASEKQLANFKQYDSNNDNVLSMEEFSVKNAKGKTLSGDKVKKKQKLFKAIDANSDKQISLDEYSSYWQKMKEKQTKKKK
ncbi:EF-hand domain-containing protein [Thalassotalea fonticola]|uniref:EF-hand domain-containing protein n=1 Tax=Thalassotalea fonticola TaxID=3065649 RepID=A0ABZ0GM38_9GAMM|nr:EF-hand domain-containing protein [Colwelliaceae bacterium S1-1]